MTALAGESETEHPNPLVQFADFARSALLA